MRIVVPIKQVPETNAVKMDETTGTMIRDQVEAIINPLDLYSIEAAIRLREAHGGEVTVISMGPPNAITALREAIAMGCDTGVLICDKAFAGSDTWSTSYTLAAGIKKLGSFDMIICGERATDGDTGQVGPGIAAFMDLPVTTYISAIDEVTGGRCKAHRLVEDGYEILSMKLPGVLTVIKEIAIPRLPTLRGKQKARAVDIPTWGPADLDVEPENLGLNGSPTRVVKIFRPKVARQCEKVFVTGDLTADDAAERLVAFLKQRNVL